MARNNHNDWTDELREMIDGVELSPSDGGWERLEADLRPRKTVWWPYAVPAAACLLLGGVFLFRGQPSESVLDVVPAVPSAMVADVVSPAAVEGEPSLQPETVLSGISSAHRNTPAATDDIAHETTFGLSPAGSLTAENDETGSLTVAEGSETVPSGELKLCCSGRKHKDACCSPLATSATEEGGPLAVGSAKQTSSDPFATAESSQFQPFDFGDEPIARQRRQRRKITVTVSAGGAFGSAGNGIYFAQAAPVTKAGGEVLDITEVIQHSTPKQTAIGLSIPISDKIDIGTGIDHMELNSVVGFGSQNLEWLGVPLRLGYRLADWGASSISLGAGFKGEKCLSASLLGMDYTEPFQWAANMGADYRVRIFGPVSFCLTPELSYYFTDTVLPTYRTDHPLTFTLRAGLSLNL